jgi:hypothetical protein
MVNKKKRSGLGLLDPNTRSIRVGSLTVLRCGVLIPEHPGSHSKHHLYPDGFLMARRYFAPWDPSSRCTFFFSIHFESDASYHKRTKVLFNIQWHDESTQTMRSLTANSPEGKSFFFQLIHQ